MIFDHDNAVAFLKEQLAERAKQNPSYSMRAFARKLELSPGGLSLILSNKKKLSAERAAEIARALELNDKETEYFVLLSQLSGAKSDSYRAQVLEKLMGLRARRTRGASWESASLSVDQFRMISEWYGFAILELVTRTPGPWTSRSVAERLGITPAEADAMMDRLKRLKLMQETSAGKFDRLTASVAVSAAIPNEAIRSYYEGVHHRSGESIRSQSPQEKAIGTQVFAFDPADLPEVKRLTDQYLLSLNQLASRGKNRTEIYQAIANVFKLTKKKLSKGRESKKEKS